MIQKKFTTGTIKIVVSIFFLTSSSFFVQSGDVYNIQHNRVQKIVEDILTYADRSDIDVKITIDDTQTFYAKTKPVIPSFQIYFTESGNTLVYPIFSFFCPQYEIEISKGMLELCAEDDMLAGLLSHEVAHIVLNHCDKIITSFVSSDMVNSTDRKMMEFEADRYALFYTATAGYKISSLREVLQKISQQQGTLEQSDYILTHPPLNERIAALLQIESEISSLVKLYFRAVEMLSHPPVSMDVCDNSIKIFSKLIDFFPKSSKLYNNLAVAYYHKYLISYGKLPEFVYYPFCDLEFEPIKGRKLVFRGRLAGSKTVDIDSLKTSYENLKKALDYDSSYINAKINLAIAETEFGNYEKAFRICNEVLLVSSSCVEALNLLGVISYYLGKPEDSEKYLLLATKIDKKFKPAHFNIMSLKLLQKNYQQVSQLMEKYKIEFGADMYFTEIKTRLIFAQKE
ncbi:MAG: M48 family metalloprotease [Endomicrobia bacterium]|nr:M48 family metalloprotease [Endomicrobiia bacterium]